MRKIKSFHVFFYILAFYLMLAFGWWTYLLLEKIGEHAAVDKKRITAQHEYEKLLGKRPDVYFNEAKSVIDADEAIKAVEEEHAAQNFMILTEGFVFFLVLVGGVIKIYLDLNKELKLNRQQRNFMLSITHELKSPIAGIKLGTETLLRRNLEVPKDLQLRLLNNSLKEANRLQTLVENILMAARLDSKESKAAAFAKERVSLSGVVNDVLYNIKMGKGKNRTLQINIQPSIQVDGDRLGLTSIALNLIENAIKYSSKSDHITISLMQQDDKVLFSVADTGVGISDEEKKHIFDKFYRVGNEDTRKTKGTGLGLHLVKHLVKLHEGKIKVTDNQPKGTIFTVELPALNIPTPSAQIPKKEVAELTTSF